MKLPLLKPNSVVYDRYKVLEFVAAGGMQEVYRARDLSFNRVVALKTPKNDHGEKRFQRSAVASASIRDPAVATTYDYFEADGRAYLVEEFIDGVDLKKVMKTIYAYLDPALAAHLATHIAKGLAACHAMTVWHRDLKPANIMVSCDLVFSTVKITDFGIAKMVEDEFPKDSDDTESSITGSATLLGAAPYMAPEHMFTPQKADKRADIWSFGALLYALLYGRPPFGTMFADIAASIKSGQYAPPPAWIARKTQFASAATALWDVIQKCLQVDPAQRPTAAALVQELSKVCYSVFPRVRAEGTNYRIPNKKKIGFLDCTGYNAMYHVDSLYRDGGLASHGEFVAVSLHPGHPSQRGFPLVPLHPPPVTAVTES